MFEAFGGLLDWCVVVVLGAPGENEVAMRYMSWMDGMRELRWGNVVVGRVLDDGTACCDCNQYKLNVKSLLILDHPEWFQGFCHHVQCYMLRSPTLGRREYYGYICCIIDSTASEMSTALIPLSETKDDSECSPL